MKFFDNFIKKQYEKRFPKPAPVLVDPCIHFQAVEVQPVIIKAMVTIPKEQFEAYSHTSNFNDTVRRWIIDRMAGELMKALTVVYDYEPCEMVHRISGKLEIIPMKEGFKDGFNL